MARFIKTLCMVLLLAATLIAPGLAARADTQGYVQPAMQMTDASMQMGDMPMGDGAPCAPKDCGKMPDCPLAVQYLPSLKAAPTAAVSVVFAPMAVTVHFVLAAPIAFASLDGDGLRRPPKI